MSCLACMCRRVTKAPECEQQVSWSIDLLAELLKESDVMRRTEAALSGGLMINFVKHTLSVFATLGLGVDVVVDADAQMCLDLNGDVDVVAINRPIPNTKLAASCGGNGETSGEEGSAGVGRRCQGMN